MNKIKKYFNIAKAVAENGDCKEAARKYRIGAVGIRSEGTAVFASNISTRVPNPDAHAEKRLVKKLNEGAIVFVVRITRDNKFANARPCATCRKAMKRRGIKKIFYSISEHEFGVMTLNV